MMHMLHAKENGAEDDRRRPAVHADGGEGGRAMRIRSAPASRSCSAPHHIFKNGWKTTVHP
jgi:hypothetical protein